MKYTVIKNRGQGGFGIVYEVSNPEGKLFAQKTYRLSPLLAGDTKLEQSSKKRFIKEAKYQKQLSHRNIVPVIDTYLSDDPPFIIMPLATASLNEDIISGEANNSNFMLIVSDIMAGLEEIHKYGIYHRDLKPSNVLRFSSTDPLKKDYYAISDFGLMSMKETSTTTLTATGSTRNSDYYTAPEIVANLSAASRQSDIYSIGCILHDFVAVNPNRIPCGEIHETSDYGTILLGCTRTDPSRRFKSIASLRDALSTVDQKNIHPTTRTGSEVAALLEGDISSLDEGKIQRIVHYFNSTHDTDQDIVFSKLNLTHIEKLIEFPTLSKQIGLKYSSWARDTSFDWDFCDTCCNRIFRFIKSGDEDLQAEGLMALLYMGTRHNRFYVERKFHNYITTEASTELIIRIAMEIRIDEKEARNAFAHLARSINISLANLPTPLIDALNDCK